MVNIIKFTSTYLGIPLFMRKMTKISPCRMNSTKIGIVKKYLSLARRTLLIQIILQATPIHLFFVLKAPKYFTRSLITIMRNFLSKGNFESHKFLIVSWKLFSFPNLNGDYNWKFWRLLKMPLGISLPGYALGILTSIGVWPKALHVWIVKRSST